MIRRNWSPAPPRHRGRRIFLTVLGGIALFVLGFFCAHPILSLFGIV